MSAPYTPRAATLKALIAANVLDGAQAQRAELSAQKAGQSPIAALHRLALADDDAVARVRSDRFSIQRAVQSDAPETALALEGVSTAFLRRKQVLPLGWADKSLLVGVVDPTDTDALAALSFAAGSAAEPRLMACGDLTRAFAALYGDDEGDTALAETPTSSWTDDATRLRDQSDAAPAVRIVNALLDEAVARGASDIHIEPTPDRVRIRFRIDGGLETVREEPAPLASALAARIKILADLDVADRRRPQDGRTSLAAKGRPIDVRVSVVPSSFGETIALRLLRRDASLLDLAALGFSPDMVDMFTNVLALRQGLFVITGPTGSGKTTTLYAMLERLRDAPLKILSVEDPIEYIFPDITQVQVNEDAGVTFASALRAFLRQDPDILLVGEIRDSETARIAVQASLTGHLVLATLHTMDAPSAVTRLVDMGVDRYLVAATLAGAAAQRLVRRLCPHCKRSRPALPAERAFLRAHGVDGETVADAQGCAACRNTGMQGRIAIGEGFRNDDALRASLLAADAAALGLALQARDFTPIGVQAARLVAAQIIAPTEAALLGLA